jgi:HNH endonuclease
MRNYRPLPPIERLNELLEVVEIPPNKFGRWSGLIWKVNRGGAARAGSVAGTPMPDTSNPDRIDWRVGLDGVKYVASRVIYFMVYGENPGNAQVDHEDQNWFNNNPGNLRLDVNGDIQQANRGILWNNTSGVVGVDWHKNARRWRAYAKRKHLGGK